MNNKILLIEKQNIVNLFNKKKFNKISNLSLKTRALFDDQPDIAQGKNSWDWLVTAYSGYDLDFNGAADVNVPAYIGFAIDDPDDSVGVLYGWAQIMIRESGGLHNNWFTLDIIDYAYDDTGAAIATGQTEATAIPGAGGLVALACGAAGLRRRRNRATTTAETA